MVVTLLAWIRSRTESDRGAALVEYALLVAFVAVLCIGSLVLIGNHIAEKLSNGAVAININ
jgi:pilus assembly protein Flp/PilA